MNPNTELTEARKRRDAKQKWLNSVKDSNHPTDRKQARRLKEDIEELDQRISRLVETRAFPLDMKT